jgi:hypothetical protein
MKKFIFLILSISFFACKKVETDFDNAAKPDINNFIDNAAKPDINNFIGRYGGMCFNIGQNKGYISFLILESNKGFLSLNKLRGSTIVGFPDLNANQETSLLEQAKSYPRIWKAKSIQFDYDYGSLEEIDTGYTYNDESKQMLTEIRFNQLEQSLITMSWTVNSDETKKPLRVCTFPVSQKLAEPSAVH